MHTSNDRRSYLLVPMMPTPNGPLHLGHIAGPYLKMDVLARSLKQAGHRVSLITTSDAYESHVLASAEKYAMTPEDVCRRFHDEIQRDFTYMDIRFDAFVNTMQPERRAAYRDAHARVVDDLLRVGTATKRVEHYLFDEKSGHDVLGYRLSGECPTCRTPTVGFVCENCGLQVTTRMLKAPVGADTPDVVWREGHTLALEIKDRPELLAQIDKMSVAPEFKKAMASFISSEENLVRLTVLGGHGVGSYQYDGVDYTLYNTYFGHALYCGDVYANSDGVDRNAFDRDSNVTTITSCGLDNATDLAACIAYAAAQPTYKGFDYCLGNFFLNLEGAKFSTSAGHAVFVRDLIDSPAVSVDAMRLYLASISPQTEVRNFDVGEFIAFHNAWFVPFTERLHAAFERAQPGPISDQRQAAFDEALATRDHALAPDRFDLIGASAWLRAYADAFDPASASPADCYGWLKSFAVLGWPLAPGLTTRLWQALGHEDEPRSKELAVSTLPRPAARLAPATRITREDFRWPIVHAS